MESRCLSQGPRCTRKEGRRDEGQALFYLVTIVGFSFHNLLTLLSLLLSLFNYNLDNILLVP